MADGREVRAPGQLGLVQAFLNTYDRESGRDELADVSAAAAWLATNRLVSPGSMAAGSWSRLKVCSNEACQTAVYDSSRNRSGRWCSMARCGNRMKGRTYRVRRYSAGDGSANVGVDVQRAVAS